MRLAPGKQLGPYEITATLGAGGMGEVYRARDTRLQRTVAIKILSQLSADPQRRQRFEREAKAISCLNHPNICVLHDIGHQDGIDYLVMECVEGETLARRLERGPLPVDQVLKYGAQIADALDKAHHAGIVHRDLKPGNIMLTPTGAKLLDFGLAKPASSPVYMAAMTATKAESPITEQGTIVGTFQYMSPEQVEGRELDGRSDIFSLGAVLYEMVTGRRAFEGKSQLSVASAILEKEPAPISSIKPMTPPGLDHIVRKCLAKVADERWQSACDLASELKWIGEGGSSAATSLPLSGRLRKRERLGWLVAAAVALPLIVSLGVTIVLLREKPERGLATRFQFALPEKVSFRVIDFPVVSPDGTRLAFSALAADRTAHIWVRRLDSLGIQMVSGTEGAHSPFWSDDSNSIGFFADGKLKRIDLSGGASQILCEAPGGETGAWNRDGVILFRQNPRSGLYRVSAAGGEPKPATELDPSGQETDHLAPGFLPDGRHFLYSSWSGVNVQQGSTTTYVGSLDSREKKRILVTDSEVAYTSMGYLLYVRGGTLFAQEFDASRLELRGDPALVTEQVAVVPGSGGAYSGFAAFSVSQNGVLSYRAGSGGNSELIWFDRRGDRAGIVGSPAPYSNPSLSPDGSRLAVGRRDPQAKTRDLWVFDLKRGTTSRLTSDPAEDVNPVWSRDGNRIFFSSDRKGQRDIYEKRANGIGAETLVFESKQNKSADDLSADDRYLVYDTGPTGGMNELWILPLFGERKPFPFVQGKFSATPAQFSPNGRFVAYSSNETGRPEVYVQTFPEPGWKWQISTDGGADPVWRRDGKELFYRSQTKLMAAEVKTDASSFEAAIPKPLFEIPLLAAGGRNQYVVTADGQRFLFNTVSQESEGSMINVVVNWPTPLKKQQ